MTTVAFTPQDLAALAARGISEKEAIRQVELLRHPPKSLRLDRPCRVGDGVRVLSPDEEHRAFERGQQAIQQARVTKFVPASGAATRMFKDLLAAVSASGRPSAQDGTRTFLEHLDRYAFAAELRDRAGVGGAPATEAEERLVLRTLLETMRYADLPKGLIPFHRAEPVSTAFDDQLEEGIGYTRDAAGRARMHFTVPPEWRTAFAERLGAVRQRIEARLRCVLDVTFSEQYPSTDTLAIDEHGQPFRTASGSLLFRPAGHGALISNLSALRGDIVAVKNIDNILPPSRVEEVVRWKTILIGVLVECQEQAHASAARPIRVCGVVRNEGEPGGAPFWVSAGGAAPTIQIVEAAQVDARSESQQAVFASSTHFNPVDVVCGVRDASGQPFELDAFVDPDTAFVSHKSFEGRNLVALERPGLWNGAMARWSTVCVEVPASTFAPVKTVLDLLRPQHQV